MPFTRSNRQSGVLPEAGIGKRHSAEVERRSVRRRDPLDVTAGGTEPDTEPLRRYRRVRLSIEVGVGQSFYLYGIRMYEPIA